LNAVTAVGRFEGDEKRGRDDEMRGDLKGIFQPRNLTIRPENGSIAALYVTLSVRYYHIKTYIQSVVTDPSFCKISPDPADVLADCFGQNATNLVFSRLLNITPTCGCRTTAAALLWKPDQSFFECDGRNG
jgi:hypothetical protein